MTFTLSRPITEKDAFRLAKILGKFGSRHDGEILSAAKMAQKLITDLGVTWDDILIGKKEPAGGLSSEIANALYHHDDLLTEREIDFLRSILTWIESDRELTPKQESWLEAILRKVRAAS